MKKKNLFSTIFLLSLFVTNSNAQFKVNADGSAEFKVGSYLAGFTGNTSQSNVFFGYKALNNNPLAQQNYNIAFGTGALYSHTTGFCNTALGGDALYSNINGYYNTATGHRALFTNTSGYCNTATGVEALQSNIDGCFNVAAGGGALSANTTGSINTAFGFIALPNNTTGELNTALGDGALPDNITGSYNVGCGPWSFFFNKTGSYNTALGIFTQAADSNLNNSTVIGYHATATSSNQVRIGDAIVSDIGGFANWTNVSDGRTKKNIRTNVPGLAFINDLQPITYNLDLDAVDNLLKIDRKSNSMDTLVPALSQELIDIQKKSREAKQQIVQTGFVAQDVEKIAKSIGYDFSGVNIDEKGIYGLRYAEFVVPLVKAVQELSEQNERFREQNERMQAQINELQEKEVLRSATSPESVTGLQSPASDIAYLQQNAPNPFSQSTQIKYYLPATVKTAYLCIYDLQGTQLKQTAIQERGEGVQILYGSELKAGMYLYTLIADGQEVDTKRMILTK